MTLTLRHVEPAWRGDCVRGAMESIRLGYVAQDFNAQDLADDVFAAGHWGHVGPHGDENPWTGAGVKAGTAMASLTSKQWVAGRLGDTTPALARDIIAAVSGERFVPCFEIKPGPGSHQVAPYADLKAAAVAHRVPCVVMTIQSYGGPSWEPSAKLRMAAAGKAGLPRMLLWREHIPADSDWWDLLEAVKGAPASQTLPAHIIRVPISATAATAWTVLARVTATADWSPTPTPAPKPTPEAPVDKMNPKSYFIGAHGAHVTWLSGRLIAHGFNRRHAAGGPYKAGPAFTETDRRNVVDFQRAQGWSGPDADGFPGASSLKILAGPPPTKSTGPKVGTAQAVIGKARLEVGYHEGRTGSGWNNQQKYAGIVGLPNGQAWCDTFVYAMAKLGGCLPLWPQPPSPGCDVTANAWKKMGRWSEYPAIGAQAFIGRPSDLVHTFLVIDYDATFIYTIEGNTNTSGSPQGDGVYARKRTRKEIVGYGYPRYPGGIVSADPKYAAGTPAKAAPTSTGVKASVADLSHFQSGQLDFAAAAKAGIQAFVHKVTDGVSFVDDLYTRRRAEAAREAFKVHWGAYHFARPEKSTGKAQAQFMLRHAGAIGAGDVQAVLDLEKTGGLGIAQLTDWAGSWVEEEKKETGALPMIYTPFSLQETFGCRLWVARYSDAMTPPHIPAPWNDKYALWQFSNGVYGHPDMIPGLGHVDLSTFGAGRKLADLLIS